jgi:2,3,4,5-tetrahydropyridine-2-carboxylate N-succinyltransferase
MPSAAKPALDQRFAAKLLAYAETPAGQTLLPDAEQMVETLLEALESGDVRAAERGAEGRWQAVTWVKRGILLGFRVGRMVDMSIGGHHGEPRFAFFDKHIYTPRGLALGDGVRVVPGGSAIRRGAYLAPGVVCMPPMYVNVGAWVGAGTMIDSHALVGSCAQIGERVHLSAAAQIGGVLEPVNAAPVVIEDDVLVGGNCGVYEGTIVRAKAVLAAGVVLTRGTPVYDLVNERVYRGDADRPLEIPAGAVVVPGARQVGKGAGWGAEQGLSLQTPVIVKYRDERTDLATALEGWLR